MWRSCQTTNILQVGMAYQKTLFVHKAGTFSIVAGYVHYHFVDVVPIGEMYLSIGMLVLEKLTR